jgi:Putative amidoligase enzyme
LIAAPLAPPFLLGPDGAPRRVGVELEVDGTGAGRLASLVAEVGGGRAVEQEAYRFLVEASGLGDLVVELDLRAAHPPAAGTALGLRRLAARMVGLVASPITPVEIVFPPLPPERLPEVDRLVAGLLARDPSLRSAGPHLNPEVASYDPGYLARNLRAFALLSPHLRVRMGLPPARRLGFTTAFPPAYRALLADPGYRPDLDRLIGDYLADNPTRYRELDMLPLFMLLAPQLVSGRVRVQKIKPRPVFHYRLPGSRAYHGVAADWNGWVEVERMAAAAS